MSRVFISPLATPFHSLVSIFPIPSRYISIFRAPPPRYFSPSLKHALDPPTARLLKALAASPLAGSERGELAGAALVQLQATWRQWCRSHAPAGTALRADPLPGAGR